MYYFCMDWFLFRFNVKSQFSIGVYVEEKKMRVALLFPSTNVGTPGTNTGKTTGETSGGTHGTNSEVAF